MKNFDLITIDELPEAFNSKQNEEYMKKYKNNSDLFARQMLIEHNLRLVMAVINQHFYDSYIVEDLFSEGLIGLISSIEKFDFSFDTPFHNYAGVGIYNAISNYLQKEKRRNRYCSLEKIISESDNGDKLLTKDLIDGSINPVDDEAINNVLKEQLASIISSLPELKKNVFLLKFGLKDGKKYTEMEIAKILNISRSYVCQIVRREIVKIKYKMEKDYYPFQNHVLEYKKRKREKMFFKALNENDLPKAFSNQENDIYIRKYKHDKDILTRNIIIEHNIKLVLSVINTNYSSFDNKEDLLSEGILGLINSIEKYDESFGVPFGIFAKRGIMNFISSFVRKEGKRQVFSLDEKIELDDIGNKEAKINTLYEDEGFEDNVIDKLQQEEALKLVYSLPDKYKKVFIMYFGLNSSMSYTQEEVADFLGYSRSGITMIIKRNAKKIKNIMEQSHISDYEKPISLRKIAKENSD